MSRAEFFKGTGDAAIGEDEYVIEVWRCNWRVFTVYRTCQLNFVGMGGTCIGLSAVEIQTALQLHGVPRSRWRDLTPELQLMGNAAATYLNDAAESRRKK